MATGRLQNSLAIPLWGSHILLWIPNPLREEQLCAGLGGEEKCSPFPDTEPHPGPSLVKDSHKETYWKKCHPLEAWLCFTLHFLIGHPSSIAG